MSEKLQALRDILKANAIDGFILPYRDEYDEEFVIPGNRRLEWLTGFTGDAGCVLIFMDEAFLLVDGRFTLQAKQEVNPEDFTIMPFSQASLDKIITAKMKIGHRMGYDPKLHTIAGITGVRKICEKSGVVPLGVKENPVDVLWDDRPGSLLPQIFLLDEKFCGCGTKDKILKVAEVLKERKEDAVILSSSQSICWLLNVRTHSEFLPTVNSYAILYATGSVDWFIKSESINSETRKALGDRVRVLPPAIFEAEIGRLVKSQKTISLDPNFSTGWLENVIAMCGGKISMNPDPCADLKAVKNAVEIAGLKNAHIKDGVALCRFFAWLESEGIGKTEYEAAAKLEEIKKSLEYYQGPSFATISASGANAAIVHYMPEKDTARRIATDDIYLLDSGSQFFDGTTDVTRTVCFTEQSDEVKARFTEVLKGHIALASALFPKGTYGCQLDALARQFLWKSGCNYAHGTGHGVGFFLNVHETPPSISLGRDSLPLTEGMIVTDEPGYYKAGAFGIRLENLLLVKATDSVGEEEMLCFEPLTLAPFDTRLIDMKMLTADEISWLNNYHGRVFDTLGPMLDSQIKEWLHKKTLPL